MKEHKLSQLQRPIMARDPKYTCAWVSVSYIWY